MNFLGNILWLILGGLLSAFLWALVGILWSITIIGLPIGIQCFKFANLSLHPFGYDIMYGGGAGSLFLSILWLIFGGFELAVTEAVIGIVLCLTIIGIPFGLQYFKLAGLALLPFGAKIVKVS